MKYARTFNFQLKPNKTSRTISIDVVLTLHNKPRRDNIHLRTLNEYYSLSVCGNTHKRGAKCQMQSEILTYSNRVRPEDKVVFDFIMEIWWFYHLNDMCAGTYYQECCLGKTNFYSFEEQVEKLKKYNLYIDRGYRYGSDWLVNEIPEDILRKILKLINEGSL